MMRLVIVKAKILFKNTNKIKSLNDTRSCEK